MIDWLDCLIDCFTKTSRALIGYFQSPVRVKTDKFSFMQNSTSLSNCQPFFYQWNFIAYCKLRIKKGYWHCSYLFENSRLRLFSASFPLIKNKSTSIFHASVLTNCEEIQKTTTEINDEYLPQDCDDGLGRRTNTTKKTFPKLQNTLRAKVNNCRKLRNTSIYIW